MAKTDRKKDTKTSVECEVRRGGEVREGKWGGRVTEKATVYNSNRMSRTRTRLAIMHALAVYVH